MPPVLVKVTTVLFLRVELDWRFDRLLGILTPGDRILEVLLEARPVTGVEKDLIPQWLTSRKWGRYPGEV